MIVIFLYLQVPAHTRTNTATATSVHEWVGVDAMSEDDRDIDVESADDVPDIGMEATASCQNPSLSLDVSACSLLFVECTVRNAVQMVYEMP